MAEKFNPAPTDKHAADPKEAVKADKATHNELQKGVKDSFPGVRSSECSATRAIEARQRRQTKTDKPSRK